MLKNRQTIFTTFFLIACLLQPTFSAHALSSESYYDASGTIGENCTVELYYDGKTGDGHVSVSKNSQAIADAGGTRWYEDSIISPSNLGGSTAYRAILAQDIADCFDSIQDSDTAPFNLSSTTDGAQATISFTAPLVRIVQNGADGANYTSDSYIGFAYSIDSGQTWTEHKVGTGTIVPTPGAEAGVTDYEYQIDSGSWVSAGTTSSPVTINNLSSGITYSINIRAVNSHGAGSESPTLSLILPTPDKVEAPPKPKKIDVKLNDGVEAKYLKFEIDDGTVDRDNQRIDNEEKFGCYLTDLQIARGDCKKPGSFTSSIRYSQNSRFFSKDDPLQNTTEVNVVMVNAVKKIYSVSEIKDGTVDRDNQRIDNERKFGCYMTDAQILRGDCEASGISTYNVNYEYSTGSTDNVNVTLMDGSTAIYTLNEVNDGTVNRDNQRIANENILGCYMTNAQILRGDCTEITED